MQKDPQISIAVKEILEIIKKIAPGRLVELRIPPYAAIQCVAGGNHKRGTPPNTVEMSGQVLLKLINDPSSWHHLCSQGEIAASGINSDLSQLFVIAATKYAQP
ncbi:MAG: sterol carrier family protein [Candidatus Nanopelagicus sp.]